MGDGYNNWSQMLASELSAYQQVMQSLEYTSGHDQSGSQSSSPRTASLIPAYEGYADFANMTYMPQTQAPARRSSSSETSVVRDTECAPVSPVDQDWKGETSIKRRREQNRRSQRAYRDRQRSLVEDLLKRIEKLTDDSRQQQETNEKLTAENKVYRELLQHSLRSGAG